jgi:hypothetical protein
MTYHSRFCSCFTKLGCIMALIGLDGFSWDSWFATSTFSLGTARTLIGFIAIIACLSAICQCHLFPYSSTCKGAHTNAVSLLVVLEMPPGPESVPKGDREARLPKSSGTFRRFFTDLKGLFIASRMPCLPRDEGLGERDIDVFEGTRASAGG